MLGSIKGRIIVILAVLAVSGFYLYQTKSAYDSWVKLGLDLKGGMHLELEVEDPDGTMTPEARAEMTDRALTVVRTRIDEFGVEEPIIRKIGDDRIEVELAGIEDEERAKEIVQRTAFLEFAVVKSPVEFVETLPSIDRAIVEALGPEAIPADTAARQESIPELLFRQDRDSAQADTAPEDSVTAESAPEEGAAEAPDSAAQDSAAQETPVDEEAGEDEAATEDGPRPLSRLLSQGTGGRMLVAEEDVPEVRRYLALPEVQRLLPRRTSVHLGAEPRGVGAQVFRELYVLEPPFMTGESLVDAQASRDQQQFNEPIVIFDLDRRGGREFGQATEQNIGGFLAIILDGEVVSAPQVQSRIGRSGRIELGRGAPIEEARDLALVLRAGALPAPLVVLDERVVSPSLGQDSIVRGQWAGILAILLVIGTIIAYYRVAGMLAIGALVVYAAMLMGGLAMFGATLTLPGIAGLILSIGMAVDANVLVFERVREELKAGRTPRTAVDEGFRHAMSAIVDSNLTTLLTALILYQIGTSAVKGFAVTLSVGIVASFFTAVYVTRTAFLLYLERKRATDTISI